MFNTTITFSTRFGYSQTVTLADAMIARERNRRAAMCDNLGETLRRVGYWQLIELEARRAARKGSR